MTAYYFFHSEKISVQSRSKTKRIISMLKFYSLIFYIIKLYYKLCYSFLYSNKMANNYYKEEFTIQKIRIHLYVYPYVYTYVMI